MFTCSICGKKFTELDYPNLRKSLIPNICPHHSKIIGRMVEGYEESMNPNNIDLLVDNRYSKRKGIV